MKPDYKNWMPKGMVFPASPSRRSFLLFVVCGLTSEAGGGLRRVLFVVFLVATILGLCASTWMVLMYRAFSYDGTRQLSKQIIEGIAECLKLPDGGKGLDVGCGSGALAIACAKRNPKASLIGIDRWGKEYASFSKALCERNARAEGAENVTFCQGDATGLDFADESFDAVTSNYVYHNISGDRQAYLLETLRVLKTGGTFALHDIFSKAKYGDMQAFVQKLRDLGYESVELIDTTDGRFMTRQEAARMGLSGSALLIGRKVRGREVKNGAVQRRYATRRETGRLLGKLMVNGMNSGHPQRLADGACRPSMDIIASSHRDLGCRV